LFHSFQQTILFENLQSLELIPFLRLPAYDFGHLIKKMHQSWSWQYLQCSGCW